jgi:hypothetical protein
LYPFAHLVPFGIASVPLLGCFFFTQKLSADVWADAAVTVSAAVAVAATANVKSRRPLRVVITGVLPMA